MFKSRLFVKVFLIIIVLISISSGSIYFVSIPLVNKTVNDLEENAARTILDSVYDNVEKLYLAFESERRSVLESRKRELKNIVLVAEAYLKTIQRQVERGLITEGEAKNKICEELRTFKYGHDDYLWIADYNCIMLSHPDPQLHKSNTFNLKDINGKLIVRPMVELARKDGEGYYSYWWRRLGDVNPTEKITYCKHLPEWKWIIGTGVYIDDIEEEVNKRREKAIAELRQTLNNNIKIARTGYVFIFDSKMNMVIHPNKNIEGTNVASLLDPVTGKPLALELIDASKTPNNELIYKWDKPEDPGNYVYDKKSWIRYFVGFDVLVYCLIGL